MTLREFIRTNRQTISDHGERVSGCRPTNDQERELWVMNDEALYQWARSEGVRL